MKKMLRRMEEENVEVEELDEEVEQEDELFEMVSEIEGYANFGNSRLTSTKRLEKIGGNKYKNKT